MPRSWQNTGIFVQRLHLRYPDVDPEPIVSLVVRRAVFVQARPLDQPVSVDPDDDRFLAAAIAGAAAIIVSGDKHLLQVSGYRGIKVLTAAQFIHTYGSEQNDGEGLGSAGAPPSPSS